MYLTSILAPLSCKIMISKLSTYNESNTSSSDLAYLLLVGVVLRSMSDIKFWALIQCHYPNIMVDLGSCSQTIEFHHGRYHTILITDTFQKEKVWNEPNSWVVLEIIWTLSPYIHWTDKLHTRNITVNNCSSVQRKISEEAYNVHVYSWCRPYLPIFCRVPLVPELNLSQTCLPPPTLPHDLKSLYMFDNTQKYNILCKNKWV